jgi:hypothetical protein
MDDKQPESTTIPSEPTTSAELPPSRADKPSTPPPRPTALQKLRFLLLRYLAKTAHTIDRNLVRLSKLLSTPAGIDTLLCTTSYTLTLVHALLSRILDRKLTNLATTIAEKASPILLPGETLTVTVPTSATTTLIAQTVGSSKALSDTIAEYRIFVRLWGLVGMYTWARSTYLARLPNNATKKEKILRGITWGAIASCFGFQVLENGAYLSSKGVLTSVGWAGEGGKARENKWWLWSSRCWAVYVGFELARLGVARYYEPRSTSADAIRQDDGEKEDKIKREEAVRAEKREQWVWWKDLASNVAYAPMTLHWSMEQGLLSEWGVGTCGIVAGGALLADAWGKTA